MLPAFRRAAASARLKDAGLAFSRNSGATGYDLTSSCLGGSEVRGCQVSSQLFPCEHPGILFPWVRRFCSQPDGAAGAASEADGELLDIDAAALSDDNIRHGISQIARIEAQISKYVNHKAERDESVASNLEEASKERSDLASSTSKENPNGDRQLQDKNYRPYLFQIVLNAPQNYFATVLDKWIEDGNYLGRDEISQVLFHLGKQRQYPKALQFMEWLERRKWLNFEEHDYSSHLDLIARVHGIQSAQKYIERVPESFRNEVLYETLLVNCVRTSNAQKAEVVFKEIRDLSLPLTVSACNQMILLYKRVDRGKVADVLMMMEKENIKPSPFTYKLLIDLKGRSDDISGMEHILKEMRASGVEPDAATQEMIARFYIDGGLTDKAEAILQEMERVDAKEKRNAIRALLRLYAALGKSDDVGRIWKLCKVNPKLEDFLAVIEAWGKLGHIKEAEEAFEAMMKTTPKPSSKYYNAMLNVYAKNKHLTKGKELAKRMSINGCLISPLTWDVLVKLYVNSGEVQKADLILQKVTEQNPDRRPLYSTYICLLNAYAKKGDIHNTEKIFDKLKKTMYPGRAPPYILLLEAYVNAKVPAYGFRERMRADNVLPVRKAKTHLEFLDKLQKGGSLELVD